jgi:tetratricopeptide (TPR) repeat protein
MRYDGSRIGHASGRSGLYSAMRSTLLICLLGALIFDCARAADDRYIPADDSVVVERLRERPLGRTDLEFRSARAHLRMAPTVLPLALEVARQAIAIARRDGDPRFLGYAQAALTPWLSQADPPTSVRLLRATLMQSVHQFQSALDELNEVLRRNPRDAQAWLTKASILQVLGRYEEAQGSCQQLPSMGAGFYAEACLAELQSLTGHASEGHQRLKALRESSQAAVDGSWLSLVLAEMEERMGDFGNAELHYHEALAQNPDAYTKAAYADYLLDRNRAPEVITLLEREQRADPLLLRLAIAYRAEHRTELPAAIIALQSRFDAARLRGDRVHLREEARFELAVLDQPNVALPLALEDWSVQKEPADARILLQCADAAQQPKQAIGVVTFIQTNHWTDQRLAKWLP